MSAYYQTNESEINFLIESCAKRSALGKLEFLRNYCTSAAKRHDWQRMDADFMQEFAKQLIAWFESGRKIPDKKGLEELIRLTLARKEAACGK